MNGILLLHFLAAYVGSGLAKYAMPLYLFLVFIIMTLWIKFVEEPDLKKRFGWRYEEYCRNVPRWIPRSTPYHLPSNAKNPNEAM
jgi:protein-S-isoprenylcysteine O-methyltransferase Ste14